MRILRAAALLFLLTGPAYAQMPDINLIPEAKSKTADEIEQDKANEKAYRNSLQKIPDAKASSDPWGAVRTSEPAKATPAKPKKTKTTGNAGATN